VTLLVAPYCIAYRAKLVEKMVLLYTLTTGFLIASIMVFHYFPVCYVDELGLTSFKIDSEYGIILLSAVAASRYYAVRKRLPENLYSRLMASILFLALAEASFTLYTDVFGMMNFVGHVFTFLSFRQIYLGIVSRGLEAPYEQIYQELKDSAQKDKLTGLYNRAAFIERIETRLALSKVSHYPLGLLLMDIDHFKSVNDTYGHQAGDKALVGLAKVLKDAIREEDMACRYGGDEFIVLTSPENNNKQEASLAISKLEERIQRASVSYFQGNPRLVGLGLSIGVFLCFPDNSTDITELIHEADIRMYRQKKLNRERSCGLVEAQ
jgi:diguanylate cyclase (GGDEF)-like protein